MSSDVTTNFCNSALYNNTVTLFCTATDLATKALTAAGDLRDTAFGHIGKIGGLFPTAVTNQFSAVAESINGSEIAKTLECYGTTPTMAGSMFLGLYGGHMIYDRPYVGLGLIAVGSLAAKDANDLKLLACSTLLGAASAGFRPITRKISLL